MKTNEKTSSQARVEALFATYPKLRQHCTDIKIQKICFDRIDIDLMGHHARLNSSRNIETDEVTYWLDRIIFIFDKEWELLGQVGLKTVKHPRQTGRKLWGCIPLPDVEEWVEQVFFHETVQQALARVAPRDNAHFIVGTLEIAGGQRLIISVPQPGKTIAQTLAEERTRAEAELKHELEQLVHST